MKNILILFFALLFNTTIHAQTISYEDFKAIIPSIEKEDFKETFDITNKLLSTTQNDSSELRGIVIYMNIFSSAGMVTSDQMTYDAFSKNAQKYLGQQLVMPAHPCIDSSANGFNSLQFITKNGTIQGTTTTSNNTQTNILCFEYFKFAAPVNPADFIGKDVRCGGILTSVEPNPNKSKIWICRLHFDNAFARTLN
ncbi:hypothetical protein F0919_07725 [Taibaiella lutea]|uniref:Uncharacterized protein n=1 Tax=Taibaiella lutea TaxID=2608001 RepID=A0A5M6CH31_9BACT|nr:hypothetical protein [Taibaiella lutea]KAA5534501.1 hypothetical protein F0919_07725 [Taibaiella lutea]